MHVFTKNEVTCTNGNKEEIIQGEKDHTTGLWKIPIGIQNHKSQATTTINNDTTIVTSNKIPTTKSTTQQIEHPTDKVRI